MLGHRRLYQSGHAVGIDAVELFPICTANRAGAVYYCIDAFNQAAKTFHVIKITIDPSYRNPDRSLMG